MWAGASPFSCQRTKLSFASKVNSVLFYWLQEHQAETLFSRTDSGRFIRKVLDLINKVKMYAAVPKDLWLKFKQGSLLWKAQIRNAKLRRMELAWELCALSALLVVVAMAEVWGPCPWSWTPTSLQKLHEVGRTQDLWGLGRIELSFSSWSVWGNHRDQALSFWSGNTDSKTLDYHRTSPREYQIVRNHTKETTWIENLASPNHQ